MIYTLNFRDGVERASINSEHADANQMVLVVIMNNAATQQLWSFPSVYETDTNAASSAMQRWLWRRMFAALMFALLSADGGTAKDDLGSAHNVVSCPRSANRGRLSHP